MVVAFDLFGLIRTGMAALRTGNIVDCVDFCLAVREVGEKNLSCLTAETDVHQIPTIRSERLH